jgi:hypothetical protein
MSKNLELDELYERLQPVKAKLEPLNHLGLTPEENARWNAIITDEFLPICKRILEIESGVCRG